MNKETDNQLKLKKIEHVSYFSAISKAVVRAFLALSSEIFSGCLAEMLEIHTTKSYSFKEFLCHFLIPQQEKDIS